MENGTKPLRLPLWLGIAAAVVLCLPPFLALRRARDPSSGFLGLALFGKHFETTRLEAVNRAAPPTATEIGYDGQFYAQVALDPSLGDPALPRALDNAAYRARRIGLPVLAWAAGLGRPAWVLQAYVLLNAVFWVLLLATLALAVGLRTPRGVLLAVALLWARAR